MRAAAGLEVAAVLLTDALPVDIRHASKIDRARVAGWAEQVLAGRERGPDRDVTVKVLVTGASGMLGGAVAEALAERGDTVTLLQRHSAGRPHREVLADVADQDAVTGAVTGQDAVVHLAAKVDITGARRDYVRTNVLGTRNVLEACRKAGVPRLVHVSSPSVAHRGEPLVGAGAGRADPARCRGHYARSKAVAELLALGGGPGLPAVVAIRPHLVWGPGDTQLVGRIVERARAGRLFTIGSGAALIDSTYLHQRRRRTRRGARPLRRARRARRWWCPTVNRGRWPSCWRRSAGPPECHHRGARYRRDWPGRPAPSSTRPGPPFRCCAVPATPRSPGSSPSS